MNRVVGILLVAWLEAASLARTAHTAIVTLRNHSYETGGSFTAVTGYDPPVGPPKTFEEFEIIATRLVAAPAEYPFQIKKLRILAAGGGTVGWSVDLWQDSNDTTVAPDAHFYTGASYTITGNIWNEIDLSADNIMVTSGGVRVGLTYIGGGLPPGIGADTNGITVRSNFVRSYPGLTWFFAENVAINGDFILEMDVDTPGVSGDYNGNGQVDAADYVLWRKGGPLANEVDAPGTVNGADYTAWRARFGNSGSGNRLGVSDAANATAPEPTTRVLLLTIAAAGCNLWRGRAA
jgi:hypothetical protein